MVVVAASKLPNLTKKSLLQVQVIIGTLCFSANLLLLTFWQTKRAYLSRWLQNFFNNRLKMINYKVLAFCVGSFVWRERPICCCSPSPWRNTTCCWYKVNWPEGMILSFRSKNLFDLRSFLEQEGVHLDAFSKPPTTRSKTVILVKNLPAFTKVEEIKNMFAKYGLLGRVILPPSGVTAIVEYYEPTEAR